MALGVVLSGAYMELGVVLSGAYGAGRRLVDYKQPDDGALEAAAQVCRRSASVYGCTASVYGCASSVSGGTAPVHAVGH
eukprot:1122424-Rhodomonas_salina.1